MQGNLSCIVLHQLQVGCHIVSVTKQLAKTKTDANVAVAVFVRNLQIDIERRSSKQHVSVILETRSSMV